MAYQNILYTKQERVAYVTLNRPDVLNPINMEVLEELEAAFQDCSVDNNIRVVVLTGKGKAFSAGADLKAVKAYLQESGGFRRFLRRWNEVAALIEGLDKPVIAAVQGYALAGGLELAMLADFIIAADNAVLGDAHGNYGLVPGGGSSQRLPRLIGVRRAKQLLYTAEFIDAATAERWGLVNKVVPAAELEKVVQELAEKLEERSPLALRINKYLVNRGMQVDLATGLEMEIESAAAYIQYSNDVAEGLAAFEAKRKPQFTGT